MLGSYRPQDPIAPRLARAIWLDLLDAARYQSLIDAEWDPHLKFVRSYEANGKATAATKRKGTPRETLIAAAAVLVRKVAGRIGHNPTDATWDEDDAVRVLWELHGANAWGQSPTPVLTPEQIRAAMTGATGVEAGPPPAPTSMPLSANVQGAIVQLAGYSDLAKVFDGAELWLAERTFYDQQGETLALIVSVSQLLWALISMAERPGDLLDRLQYELLLKDLAEDIGETTEEGN